MQIRPHRIINRRKTKKIKVGKVSIGGDSPISVQSMTNTITSDETSTINQVNQLKEVGADLVRISCPDQDATKALKNIIKKTDIPILADIHFHYKTEAAKSVPIV